MVMYRMACKAVVMPLLKYQSAGGHITLRLVEEAKTLSLRHEDDGNTDGDEHKHLSMPQ